jgi:hypothetical protein
MPRTHRFNPQDAELTRLHRVKQSKLQPTAALGPEMVSFFKQSVSRRHTKLSKIAECWGALVPETLNDHCALESLTRGSLAVIVDSSSHLYELKQLLLAGLEQQLLLACRSSGLRKITLKPGRWYDDGGAGDGAGDRKLRFQ